VPADEEAVRYVVRVPRRAGGELSRVLREVQAQRSARKHPHVRVEVDPHELG
jgi:primosomal protein N' (replication factor Y) (superfamily II helicase)